MPKDVLITPLSSKIEFKDNASTIDGLIQLDASDNLSITSPNGTLNLGNGGGTLFIGDGTNTTDVIFEQNGTLKAADTKTLTIGSTTSTTSVSGNLSISGLLSTQASNTTLPSLRIPHGTAPSSPTNGDVWTTTSGLFSRINGTTQQYAPLSSPTFTTPRISSDGSINDSNGNELIKFPAAVSSAENELLISNSAAGQPVNISTSGSDANVNLLITTKGNGNIVIDTGAGTGDIEIKPGAANFRLYDDDSSHYYQFVTGNRTANYSLTLPPATGTLLLTHITANAEGYFYTGTTNPIGTTRLNYSGYFYPTFINLIGSSDTATTATHYFVETGSDGFVRPKTLANVRNEIVTTTAVNAAAATTVGVITSGVWQGTEISSTYTAAKVLSVNGLGGHVTGLAPLDSPTFTGSPAFNSPVTFSDGTTTEGRIVSSGDTFYVQAGINSSDTGAKLNITRNSTTSTAISQFNVYSSSSTFHGDMVRAAGGHGAGITTNVFHGIIQPFSTALPSAGSYAEGTIIVRYV